MNVREFLGIERLDEQTWQFRVTERLITPGKFLFGGCGLASGIVALEEASGRSAIYAAAQYLSFAPLGAEVRIRIELVVTGSRVTQARATTTVDEREILAVTAALGRGELNSPEPWTLMPDVPAPEDCPVRVLPSRFAGSIFDHLETRVAMGRPFEDLDGTVGSPLSALWVRVPYELDISPATLAIVGDLVSGGVTQPLGRRTMGRSLDNTIRVATLSPTQWVLCVIDMHALVNGFAQGTGFLWSREGVLLGTASQTLSAKFAEELS